MFKIVSKQEELTKALSDAQRGINNKTTLGILKNFYLEVANNSLKVTGYDGEISVSSVIDVDVITEGSTLIEANLFNNIIKKLPNDNIELYVEGKHLFINCQKSRYKLDCSTSEDYPKMPTLSESKSIKLKSEVFKKMIKETVFATSSDQTKPILTGELLEVKDNILNLVALDGYRLAVSKATLQTNINDCQIVIPSKTLQDVSNLLGNTEEFTLGFDEKYAIFEFSNKTIISRLLDGQFVNYNQLIRNEHNTLVTINKNSFLGAIERASLVCSEKNNLIKFMIRDNSLHILSNNGSSNASEEVSIDLSGEYLDIAFNSRYLLESLRIIDEESITLEFTTNVNPCTIRPISDNKDRSYLYLLLPVRVSSTQ